MNAPYPTARVIALYTLLTPMLFGFGVGLPLGVLMLPVVLASMLYGFLPALACGCKPPPPFASNDTSFCKHLHFACQNLLHQISLQALPLAGCCLSVIHPYLKNLVKLPNHIILIRILSSYAVL